MERILCLDVGDKYIGLAVSDPLGITAQPLKTHKRRPYPEELAFFTELIESYQITRFIAGLPLHSDGTPSKQSEKVKNYIGFLKKRLKLPVEFVSEEYTTQESKEILDLSGIKRSDHKKVIDTLAAQLMLQDYLEDQRIKRERADRNEG